MRLGIHVAPNTQALLHTLTSTSDPHRKTLFPRARLTLHGSWFASTCMVDEEPSDSAPFLEDVTGEYDYPDRVVQRAITARLNGALRRAVENDNFAAAEMILNDMNHRGVHVELDAIYEHVTTYYLRPLEALTSRRTPSFQKTLDKALLWWCLVPDHAGRGLEKAAPDFKALVERLLRINLLPSELASFVFIAMEKGYASHLNTIIDHIISYSSPRVALETLAHINRLDVRAGREVRANAKFHRLSWIKRDSPYRSILFGSLRSRDSDNVRRRIDRRVNRAIYHLAAANKTLTAHRLLGALFDASPRSVRPYTADIVLRKLREGRMTQEHEDLAERIRRARLPLEYTQPHSFVVWNVRKTLFSDHPPSIQDLAAFMRRCYEDSAVSALRAMERRIAWRLIKDNPRSWKPVTLWFLGEMQRQLDEGRYEEVFRTFATRFRLQGVPGQSLVSSYLQRHHNIDSAKPSNSLVPQLLKPTPVAVRILLQALFRWRSTTSIGVPVAVKRKLLLKEMFQAFSWNAKQVDPPLGNILEPGTWMPEGDGVAHPILIPPDTLIFDFIFRYLSSQRLCGTVQLVKKTLKSGITLPITAWSIVLYRIALHGDGQSTLALLRAMTQVEAGGEINPNLPPADFSTYLHAISAAWRGRHLNLLYDVTQMLRSQNLEPADEQEVEKLQFYLSRYSETIAKPGWDTWATMRGKSS
ncbi:uncharacterized protein EI90DRAFT_3075518 [Cantharellus anzutake]|uniref:uncharacterized protein n=1 Tax=Cantharellus anzutake TaxID=1750568 RepID=UPI001903B291|nr:uncharacterized protein EI90DRAFT_3075518 [Cantharellus anzutake]KAF8324478.1 hypothetical protein EI90DRAFT_3075518 [Cantharellus anzutake]